MSFFIIMYFYLSYALNNFQSLNHRIMKIKKPKLFLRAFSAILRVVSVSVFFFFAQKRCDKELFFF